MAMHHAHAEGMPHASSFESAGKLPTFSLHGVDLEMPGALAKVVSQVAYRRELILVCGDAKPSASAANGLNTVLALRALRLHHILYLSDSSASCAALRLALPEVACVWSSRINATKPRDAGLCVQLYWGFAFYFYDLRKHYLARMAVELGINVLQTDTDVVWLGNPYPALKGVFAQQQIIAMQDRPMVNAGVFYAQNVREGDGASWVLRELARRIHTFLLRPSAVKDYVPWAQPPFFANVDEQTLMNDCVRSAIANVCSFAQATAGWEVKKHRTGTVMNKSFSWKATPEYRLVRWLDRVVPAAGRRQRLPVAVPVREVCGAPSISSPGTVFPLHDVGTNSTPSATLAIAPLWLFMHLPSKPASNAIDHCRAAANQSLGARAAAPFIMGHLAGVRTGAWSRRALIRAYGWWHPAADHLIARQLGWGRRAQTLSLLGSDADSLAELESVVRSQAQLDMLVGNLLLLGNLLGRRIVVPEIPCGLFPGVSPKRGYGTRPVAARPEAARPACAWMPPKACWATEYSTQLEAEREISPSTTTPSSAGADLTPPRSVTRAAASQVVGRGPIGGATATAACDEVARQLAHALAPAVARATSDGASTAAGTARLTRNHSTVLAVRRRLRELPCDTSAALALLPPAPSALPSSPALPHSPRNRDANRSRNRGLILELLVRAPLLRHPKWPVLRILTNVTSPLLDVDAVRKDSLCIEVLFQSPAAKT